MLEFFIDNIKDEDFNSKRIVEVGSKYVNGSIQPIIKKYYHPKEYFGVDISPGKMVDLVLSVEELSNYFGADSFDTVISTEMIEHIKDWRLAINAMKTILKPNGTIFLTTRSKGFGYHGYPYDFWRYEVEDLEKIFSDFKIISLKKDKNAPGVFLKAQKNRTNGTKDLSSIELYSMILGKRINRIVDVKDMPVTIQLKINLHNIYNRSIRKFGLNL